MKAYQEVVEWLAAGPSVMQVANFQASPTVKARVANLLHREKTVGLLPDEKSELDHYEQLDEQLEHIMRLAKARAAHRLAHEHLDS